MAAAILGRPPVPEPPEVVARVTKRQDEAKRGRDPPGTPVMPAEIPRRGTGRTGPEMEVGRPQRPQVGLAAPRRRLVRRRDRRPGTPLGLDETAQVAGVVPFPRRVGPGPSSGKASGQGHAAGRPPHGQIAARPTRPLVAGRPFDEVGGGRVPRPTERRPIPPRRERRGISRTPRPVGPGRPDAGRAAGRGGTRTCRRTALPGPH